MSTTISNSLAVKHLMYARIFYLILLSGTVYCSTGKQSENSSVMNKETSDFTTLHKGLHYEPSGGVFQLDSGRIQIHKITTSDEWHSYLDEAVPDRHERDSLPDSVSRGPDFERSDIIALNAGQRGSSGYSVTITKVTIKDDMLLVTAVETIPGRNCMNLSVITWPFHYVNVPKSDFAVDLLISEITEEC